MPGFTDPAITALLTTFPADLVWAQALISRKRNGFELRHEADQASAAETLELRSIARLRDLALHTAAGAFRPLKSAPTLRRGWRAVAENPQELSAALDHLYPGSVADWYATREGTLPVTNYREFTSRQTGMYRITTHLTDAQAREVVRATCSPRFCLKQRLWTVEGLEPDPPSAKSLIPCLEPCPILLEFARKSARLEQAEKLPGELTAEDVQGLLAALEFRLEHPDPAAREADFGAPDNPRRLQLLLEKLRGRLKVEADASKED